MKVGITQKNIIQVLQITTQSYFATWKHHHSFKQQ